MTATESKWAGRVREWKASGRSASEFAQGREFAPATLVWWSSRVRGWAARGAGRPVRSDVRMARVIRTAAMPASESLTVRVGVAGIEVRAGFDRELLREVVAALGGAT